MPIPIPSSLSISPMVDVRKNDLVSPPAAPSIVESLSAIDPRVALNMPMPVGDSAAGNAVRTALQNGNLAELKTMLESGEPSVQQAVLLEISNLSSGKSNLSAKLSQANLTNLVSENLSKMDSLGSAALGQLLSEILIADAPEAAPSTQNPANLNQKSVVVSWPEIDPSKLSTQDPKAVMGALYQSLQSSGIFAADQLKRVLFPAGSTEEKMDSFLTAGDQRKASELMAQLSNDAPIIRDSMRLLLRGDLLWQGQLMPNVQGRLYREDAWQSDPHQPNQLEKGSRITLEVGLPNLGPLKIIGTQFGESLQLIVQADPVAHATMSQAFAELEEQLHTQIDSETRISLGQVEVSG
ncbi:hypothetical protein FD967_02235 [Polynucleobacter sp. JS-Mosq-20-D10]|uniref:hypothetical protein n=1 Tax=Polynucleobacter sp. JS-Mosq-20-D10 TaxID=2576922 RepID=UPI001BFDA7A3|nr:hypothetical protein [Polynucleobacter sp. JS-Mosq-20-D10]QWE00886.1 hypothetical protein FD967_02235 [Polynucleobacter sp. JS-Mosq-20-D10]